MDVKNQVITLTPSSDSSSNNNVGSAVSFSSENFIKTEAGIDSDFQSQLLNEVEFKIETEKADVKRECFDENKMEYCNQSLSATVGEEHSFDFDADMKDIRSTIKDNVINVPDDPDSQLFRIQPDDKNISEFKRNKTDLQYERLHIKKKPYSCDVCEKSFIWESYLIRHRRIHTGEKSYSCDECNKLFRQKASLDTHKLIHTGEEPFTCDMCRKTFRQKANLDMHKRIHTGDEPFSCDVCKKAFRWKKVLNNHKLIHTGEKPFSCDVCKKVFREKTHLVRHNRIHTGEKPFSCDVCKKRLQINRILLDINVSTQERNIFYVMYAKKHSH